MTLKSCTFLHFLAAAFILFALSPYQSHAKDRTLIIGTWGGALQKAQQEAYFKKYQSKSGVIVVDKQYPGDLSDVRRSFRKTGDYWDIVQVESMELKKGCKEKILAKIDWKKIPQKEKLTPVAKEECGVGALVWSMVLGFDKGRFKKPPSTWKDFWDVKTYPGKRGLRRSAKFTLEIALLADGVPLDQVYTLLATKEGYNRAFKKLDALRPHITWWETGEQPVQWLQTHHVLMTAVYSGRIFASRKSGHTNLEGLWNQGIVSMDYWAILNNSLRKHEAHEFIATASEAENQADLAKRVAYAPTNIESSKFLEESVSRNLLPYSEKVTTTLQLDTNFWVKNSTQLEQKFYRWLNQIGKYKKAEKNKK